MEWKKLPDKHKVKPGEVVIESSAGRLILCEPVERYLEKFNIRYSSMKPVTDLEYMEE